jgi:hypothetical protein
MEAHFKKLNWDKKYHYVIKPVQYSDNQPTVTEKEEEESTSASPAPEEDNSISIKGGFEKVGDRLLQCHSLNDNNKVTYISRSLFKSKPEKHLIMIACFIPPQDELDKLGYGFDVVEQNIINSTAQILWENGLKTEQLWREFDLNRSASPLIYLERTRWLKLLEQIDKQLEWMNQSYGEVTATYTPYVATILEITGIDIGVPGGYIGSPGSGTPSNPDGGSNPDIGDISDTAKAVWTFFTGKGFTQECTAGIMGNLQQESGMDPTKYQSGGGVGRGICQWTVGSDRFKNLEAHAKSNGKDWKDFYLKRKEAD